MSHRLIFYDTCNFRDYPIGGQLTSIRNFLLYLSENRKADLGKVLLVGASYREEEIGKIVEIQVGSGIFSFLAVARIETDLSNVKRSLRMSYAQGLWKYRKLLKLTKSDCNYIHTPEAFGVIRAIRPGAVCCVLSHGSYIGMWKKLRFFNRFPVIQKLFQAYLMQVISRCNVNFVLDHDTLEQYSAYSDHVVRVSNSIHCKAFQEKDREEGKLRLIYTGRLSDGKNLQPVIEAVRQTGMISRFFVIGDGEERERLEACANADPRIVFTGAVRPEEVEQYLKKSDVMIMNSKYEGIPMTILEALCNSLPVISTDVGGIKEVLHFGVDSECTDGTPGSIRKAFDRIEKNYAVYAKAAWETSRQYDYRVVNEKIFGLLNEYLLW